MKKLLITSVTLASVALIIFSTFSPSDSRSRTTSPGARSGGPGDAGNTCAIAGCHITYGVGVAFARAGWITSDIPGGVYVPGATYNITVAVNSQGYKHGFEASCQTAAGVFKGTLIANDTTQLLYAGANSWITHMDSTRALQHFPQILPCQKGYKGTVHNQNLKSWTFQWIAPAAGSGAVSFYMAAVAANGNGSDNAVLYPPGSWAGDSVFTSTLALTENATTNFSGIVKPCNGASNGSATVTAGFGTGPYTYLWNPSAQTTASATGLAEGNYTVTLTDALSANMTLKLTLQNNITAQLNDQNTPTCPAGVATHTVLATGGTTPYTYAWSNGQTTQQATGLVPATYSVTVTDAVACATTYTFNATDKPAMHVWFYDWQDQNVTTYGGNNGYAKVQREYNSGTYSYAWSNGQTTQTASNLIAGVYSVSVTATGCPSNTGSATVTITQPPPPLISGNYINLTGGMSQKIDTFPNVAIVPGFAGAGQTYNFSLLNSHLNSVSAYITPASGVLGANYPMTNLCMHQDTSYMYFDTSATKLDFWGVAGNLLNIGSNKSIVYSNPETKITFPSTYLTAFSDASAYDNYLEYMAMYQGVWVDSVRNKQSNTINSTIDGYGTVILPTYSVSCIRQNVLTHTIDSSWAKIFVGGFHYWIFVSADTANYRTYNYISDTYGPVVEMELYADNSTIARVRWNGLTLSVPVISPITNVSCNGGNNGFASAIVAGGTPPYTYAWSTGPVQTTSTATGLSAGSYTLVVSDATTQTTTATFTITEPVALTATVSASTDVLCFGNSTGSATALAGGGTTPYAYLWNDPGTQATATATGLVAGNYTATITDANGCPATTTVAVTEPAALTPTITASTNVLCYGNFTGSATASGSGGTGVYTYSWNTSPVKTTATITGLAAGTYVVTVKDANNCSGTTTVTITQPSFITTSLSQVNVLCKGANTGSGTVVAGGGTGAYTYSWNTSPVQTTATATGLIAGFYTVTVTDANGCAKNSILLITQPATAVTASVSATTNVLCKGNNTGSATAAGSGGTGTKTYSWNTTPVQTTATATGLTAGGYTATVTDANGCSTTTTVTITEPAAALTATATATAILCNGGTSVITVSGSGGTPSYTGTGTYTVTAGTYSYTITDNNSCTALASIAVTEPAAVTASTSVTDATCGNADGTTTVTASGGTGTLTYLWNDPGAQTTPTATGLLAGSFTVTVTDANGCALDVFANVSNLGAATVSVTATTDVTCNGGNNGDATATASGGTGTLTYLWDDVGAQTTLIATGLSAGTYNLTVTDGVGCITIVSATINEPTAVTATITATNVNCNGGNDGSATAAAGGGTGSITYLWSDGAAQTTATAIGLTAGAYTVTATDASGCTGTATVTITEPTVLTATSTATAILCNGGSSVITVSGSGGTPSYTGEGTFTVTAGTYSYTVTDNNGCAANTSITVTEPTVLTAASTATAILCNGGSSVITVSGSGGTPSYTGTGTFTVTAGTYSYTVTDNNGCAVNTSITVTEPTALTTTASVTNNVSCNGGSDGSAAVAVGGGTGTYTYLWSNGSPNPTAGGLSAADYTVTVTDANGCSTTATVTVTEPAAALTASVVAVDESICGANDGSVTANATGGTGPYTFLWSNGATTSVITGLAADTFYVSITDANGCVFAGNDTVNCLNSVNNVHVINEVSVYPNPSSGNITIAITVASNESYTVKVINLTGQVVYNETIHLTTGNNLKTINLESYSDGLYMIQLISKDEIKYLPHMISR